MSFYAALDAIRNWDGFRLEPAKVAGSANIFRIGEFISAPALLVIVVTVSDFRYRYRFAVQRLNVQTLGIWVAATIGALLLLTESLRMNRREDIFDACAQPSTARAVSFFCATQTKSELAHDPAQGNFPC